MRVTEKVLDAQLQRLNNMTKEEYKLYYAYGGVMLGKKVGTSFSEVTGYLSKTEMSRTLEAVMNLLYFEK